MPDSNIISKLQASGTPIREDAAWCNAWCASHLRTLAPPTRVAIPADRAQLAALLESASREKLSVLVAGGGSKRGCGGVSRRGDLAVSTEKLNRVVEYPASDLTITVEAGITVAALRKTLAQQGQMLPLEVPFADTATIGGTLAANQNGPRRLGYGGWRDIVIGIEFATADGKLARSGGKVVKNVAGYDLPKLLIGSFGTLGILTEVSLKVFPIPPASATFVFGYETAQAADEAARAIQSSQFFPQALQLVDAPAAAIAGAAATLAAAHNLLVSVAGPPVVIERARRDLPAMMRLRPGSGPALERHLDGAAEADLWKAVAQLTPAFLAARENGVVVKASLPLTQLAPLLADARNIAAASGVSTAVSAQAGSGIVHLYFWHADGRWHANGRWPADSSEAAPQLIGVAQNCVARAEQLGGRATVEWFPPEFDGRMNPWGTLGGDFALMQQIKKSFDPQGILNPGRFYGGI